MINNPVEIIIEKKKFKKKPYYFRIIFESGKIWNITGNFVVKDESLIIKQFNRGLPRLRVCIKDFKKVEVDDTCIYFKELEGE